MTSEHVTTSLRLAGDWPWWLGLGAALLLGAGVWPLYWREVRGLPTPFRLGLPALRSLAVVMIVAMLSGPVLHHRTVIGELSRLLLFVDASRSMGLTDSAMELGRKLRILQQLGYLAENAAPMDLPKAGEALAEARSLAARAAAAQGAESSDWSRLLADFTARLQEARDSTAQAGNPEGRAEQITKELLEPAQEIAHREMRQTDDRKRAAADLARLAGVAAKQQDQLASIFRKTILDTPGSENSPVRAALQRFDATPRAQRLRSLLLEGGSKKLLERLSETHEVQLFALENGTASRVWQSGSREGALPQDLPASTGEATDLATGLKTVAGSGNTPDQKGAIVLLSDGQHNEGESPQAVARLLAGRQWPIYPVGFGGTTPPQDLAVVRVEAPESVFSEDRVRGQVTLKDDMPSGLGFHLTVRDGEKVLWEKELRTEGKGLRQVPFDFAISDSVKAHLGSQREGVQVAGVPLELKVAISQLEGDREPGNNEAGLRLRAVTQKRKVLILDGRPRWETRYLRNLFERDEQWEVNAVVAGVAVGEPGFRRGEKPESLPSDVAQLKTYDLIVFGDIPRALWRGSELEWIRDFVGQRGGALIFIDGARGSLREYADTPLGPLIPVEWKAPAIRERIGKLSLGERAQGLAAFALAPERAANSAVWQGLPAPHWLSGATALPGSETLLECEAAGAPGDHTPAVVLRPFGAGRVLYQAFEDSWRWRYEVADEYHIRYWNQVAGWIAEFPFAVRDKFVSLDAGAITYRPGESADLRVRLNDSQGRPVTDTVVDAVLYRNGERYAALRLTPDENNGGLFRGRTAALDPGQYEVGLESAAIAERDARARTGFKVAPRETGELTQLSANEELLRQMATESGGQYLREENMGKLVDLLAPLSQGRVVESDTVLWQSYWWFVPIILLLTAEWIGRKRSGLV